jgi:tetratricopeptide (TPR) repeat protein
MIADPNEWTVIFSKNHTSWGSFFYNAAEDQLRVKVKPVKATYHEALTYDFLDSEKDKGTLALLWEDLAVPMEITLPDSDALYMKSIAQEMRAEPGFDWQNQIQASQYALEHNHPAEGLQWAQSAVSGQTGQENFRSLIALSEAQDANGKGADATATREKAFNHPSTSPTDLHLYARQLLNKKKKDEAIKVWQLNARLHPNVWPVNVGLARANSATGNYPEAAKYAKLALAQAPDEANKKALEGAVKKLEAGQDMN